MSTIYGIVSLINKLNETDFLKMTDTMKKDNYVVYGDDHIMVATTEDISNDGNHIFCGRIRNMIELKKKTQLEKGNIFDIYKKLKSVNDFDGHFIWIDRNKNEINIYKDALGIESFYYYFNDGCLYFASEIKGLLCLKDKWTVGKDEILQVLGLLPALDLNKTPYQDIYHLGPGEQLSLTDTLTLKRWWKIPEYKNSKSKEEIIDDIKKLVHQSIQEDMTDQTACMLSGGLDSSIITSVVASLQKPNTYDVIYEDNEKFFKSYAYQTTLDKPFIEAMKAKYSLNHTTVLLSQEDLSNYLIDVLLLRDLPGMVDIDSSLLLFCNEISKKESVILSGECADEFFGGYPWFYKTELQDSPYFPWTLHVEQKKALLKDGLNIDEYLIKKRNETIQDANLSTKNKIMYLTMRWFMQTLIVRGDVIGRATNLDIRMPFASKPLFEYLWNVDWEYFYEEGKEKMLLREAFKDLLPQEIYTRKKNPYPKTHSPEYTNAVIILLKEVLEDKNSILYKLFKREKLEELIKTKGTSFSLPWYGQLMTGPQLIAFIYTIYQWEKHYPINLDI